jgi:hypothetical protein
VKPVEQTTGDLNQRRFDYHVYHSEFVGLCSRPNRIGSRADAHTRYADADGIRGR